MTPARTAPTFRRAARALFAGAVLVQLAVLYWPRQVGGGDQGHLDKVVHLLVFAAVAWTGRRAGLPAAPLAAVLVLHAVVSEVLQALVLPDRAGDAADVVADLAGVLAGTLLAQASWRHERAAPAAGDRAGRPPPGGDA